MKDAASEGATGLMRGIVSGAIWTMGLVVVGFCAGVASSIAATGWGPDGTLFWAATVIFRVGAVIAFAVWAIGGLLGVFLATIFFGDAIRQARWFWPLVGAVLAPLAVVFLAAIDMPLGLMPMIWAMEPLQQVFEDPVVEWDLVSLTLLVVPIYAAIGWRVGVRFRGPWGRAGETTLVGQTSPHKKRLIPGLKLYRWAPDLHHIW